MQRVGHTIVGITLTMFFVTLFACARGAGSTEGNLNKVVRDAERSVHSTFGSSGSGSSFMSKWEARQRRMKIIYLVFVLVAAAIIFSVGSGGLVKHRARVFEASLPGGASGLPPPEELKKNVFVGYMLWFFLGFVGAHRAYVLKPVSAACMCLGYLGVGIGSFFVWSSFMWPATEVWWLFFLSWVLWMIFDALMLQGWIMAHNREVDALYEVRETKPDKASLPVKPFQEPKPAKAENAGEIQMLRARVAELEAELNRKNAALAEFAIRKNNQ
jgi:TM2 domain-containing membrane protein YozV